MFGSVCFSLSFCRIIQTLMVIQSGNFNRDAYWPVKSPSPPLEFEREENLHLDPGIFNPKLIQRASQIGTCTLCTCILLSILVYNGTWFCHDATLLITAFLMLAFVTLYMHMSHRKPFNDK